MELEKVYRNDLQKDVVYRQEPEVRDESWVPLFVFSCSLNSGTYLERHLHTAMKEAFCVESGHVVIEIENALGERSTVNLEPGEFVLVDEGNWHTIKNMGKEPANFLAMGLVSNRDGVTVNG